MATSGSTDYDLNGLAIIEHALRLISVLGQTESADSSQQTSGLVALNIMIKSEQTKLGLWRRREGKIFTVDSQGEYDLPGANAADLSELSETTLDAAEASGQTTLSVTSTSGFTASDVIGVVQDDDTIHWSTISSFVADDTVTIAAATTAAASSGNKVFVYTNAMPRPLRILSMRSEQDDNEISMFGLSHDEYFDLPNKTTEGRPTEFYYDAQTGTGKLYVWPEPDTVDVELNVTYLDSLEDFDATTDTGDFPQEWLEYMVFNLALRLAPMYGATASQEVVAMAAQTKAQLEDWDNEESDVYFGVSDRHAG